jgi:carbamoyltransferase
LNERKIMGEIAYGQPIVCSPKDALETFINSGLDALAKGNFYVTK